MEAATPLRQTHVRVVGDRLVVDGLVVSDECAVRLVREREEQGGDTAKLVTDAVEIGARVLDREQTGANAEFVKTEFERAARELEGGVRRAQPGGLRGADQAARRGLRPRLGQLAKALERHFSDGSTDAVQHRVKEVVVEVMGQARQELLRQFTAGDGLLADFKAGTHKLLETTAAQQHAHLRAVSEQLEARQARAREAARRRRTSRRRSRPSTSAAPPRAASTRTSSSRRSTGSPTALGDTADAVGDLKGATRKTGDVVVAIDACNGPARGRIVFEAKNKRLSRPDALRELDAGLVERDASFAVLVVPSEDKVPAKMSSLREYNGDKLVVSLRPRRRRRSRSSSPTSSPAPACSWPAAATRASTGPRCARPSSAPLAAMEDVRRIKSQLTGATTSIENAKGLLDGMADRVRGHLKEIDALLEADAEDPEAEAEAESRRDSVCLRLRFPVLHAWTTTRRSRAGRTWRIGAPSRRL